MVWPNGSQSIPTVSSEFSTSRRNPVTGVVQPHWGIDLVGWDVVRAPFAGTIIFAGYNGGAGNEVRIRRPNGDVLRLLHNRAFIRSGGNVAEGEPVAYMGTTGQSTGKHCHYETKPGGGTAINPRGYMSGSGGGSANVGAGQRTAGPNGVKRRSQPTSQSAEAGELLAPGVVGNFDGWIRGENVSGNDVWYRGVSGNWFWSGGFVEGANGTGLADLNPTTPAPIGGAQRRAIAASNGRADASTAAAIRQTLPEGTVGDFDGWKHGTSVEGEDRWIRGAHSGDWFWLGAFEPRNVDNLANLNPATPAPASNERTVLSVASANGRSGPGRSFPVVQSLDPGTVGTFNGYAKGEAVEGIDVWFRGAFSGHYFWAGGFTSQSVDGLPLIGDAPTEPTTPPVTPPTSDPDNPRGLPEYDPIYPGAAFGLVAPLGDGTRDKKGTTTVVPLIDRFIVHHTATTADQLDFFSYKNSRSVAPTWYLRTSGDMIELIRPGMKPAATGADWNYRSVAVETQNETGAPEWRVTDAQLEALAQAIAWLASYNGRELDGIPVSFTIDREHVIGHGEVLATECPGPYLRGKLDSLVTRAQAIYDEEYAPNEPDPEPEPGDTIPVDRSTLEKLFDWLKGVLGR